MSQGVACGNACSHKHRSERSPDARHATHALAPTALALRGDQPGPTRDRRAVPEGHHTDGGAAQGHGAEEGLGLRDLPVAGGRRRVPARALPLRRRSVGGWREGDVKVTPILFVAS